MRRWEWWVGIGAIVGALLVHAAIPRYELISRENGAIFRFDRWTGHLEIASDLKKVPWADVLR